MPAIGWEICPTGFRRQACHWHGTAVLLRSFNRRGGDRMRLIASAHRPIARRRSLVSGGGDHLGHVRRLSQRRSGNYRICRTCLSGAGSTVLAGAPVAQQQNARASDAGAGMAHHRNDEIDFARRLHPIVAQDRIRETALRTEQGNRQTRPALVRRVGAQIARRPCRRGPRDQLAHHDRGHRDRHRRSGRRDLARLGTHPGRISMSRS